MLITGVDQELGNVLTFGMGLCSSKSTICFWWIINKFIEKCGMIRKHLKLVFAPLMKKLFTMLEKELPAGCQLLATHHSVIDSVQRITSTGSALEVQDKAMSMIKECIMTDDKEVSKMRLAEILFLLQPHPTAYKKFIKQVMNYKRYWLSCKFRDVFTGG